MVRGRVLFCAVVAVLAVSLSGCYETAGYPAGGYVAPVYAGGYYGAPYYGGGYYGGGYGYRTGVVGGGVYRGGVYRHAGYYHGGYGHGGSVTVATTRAGITVAAVGGASPAVNVATTHCECGSVSPAFSRQNRPPLSSLSFAQRTVCQINAKFRAGGAPSFSRAFHEPRLPIRLLTSPDYPITSPGQRAYRTNSNRSCGGRLQ